MEIKNLKSMELKKLKNPELNEKIKTLAQQERKLTQDILEHVAEVDRRKLYLALSYPSLFDYMTREIGYSAAAAQRRIDAARLLQRVPEVSKKIESGSINLSQISKMQQICRQIKRESGQSVQVFKQKEIIEKLENQGSQSTDLILARELGVEIKFHEKKQIQRDESVRLELTFSKEEMAVLQKAKELLSHKSGGSLKSTFLAMAARVIKSYEHKKSYPAKSTSSAEVTTIVSELSADLKAKARLNSQLKTVTPRLKKEILNRDVCCQFKDPSGRICGSKHFLEIDHIQPRFAGGANSSRNLRVLCSAHNKFRYKQSWGGLRH